MFRGRFASPHPANVTVEPPFRFGEARHRVNDPVASDALGTTQQHTGTANGLPRGNIPFQRRVSSLRPGQINAHYHRRNSALRPVNPALGVGAKGKHIQQAWCCGLIIKWQARGFAILWALGAMALECLDTVNQLSNAFTRRRQGRRGFLLSGNFRFRRCLSLDRHRFRSGVRFVSWCRFVL